MSSSERARRRYHLACRRCQRTWGATYEVITYHDLDADHELFFLHGAPVAPPWSGIACPHCGGLGVTIIPVSAPAPSGGNRPPPQ